MHVTVSQWILPSLTLQLQHEGIVSELLPQHKPVLLLTRSGLYAICSILFVN